MIEPLDRPPSLARCRGRGWWALLVLGAALAACSPPPHVVVNVLDPAGGATGAEELYVGLEAENLQRVTVSAALVFPVQITVSGKTSGAKQLRVEARAGDGTVLARGTGSIELKRVDPPVAAVELHQLCTQDSDCAGGGTYCDGPVTCELGECVFNDRPCVAPFSCVVSECVEETESCLVTIDHTQCQSGTYCDPTAGCIPGLRCHDDAECQDGSACNGEELCVGYHCVAGLPPDVDDHDLCTVDGCDPTQELVIHHPLESLNGVECTVPGTSTSGVCVAEKGGCALSECGDGVVDAAASEICDRGDNNSDDYSAVATCRTDCSGWAGSCGDGVVDEPFETCDDGDARDTLNGCSGTCQLNAVCSDGIIQTLIEECDDGPSDTNECDGCRTDCMRGCICSAPAACTTGEWCASGVCSACDSDDHCGPACEACAGATPACRNATDGCGCATDPAPRGSCAPGRRCVSGECVDCNDATHCGPDCAPCSGDTPDCVGVEARCVTPDCTGKPDYTPCVLDTTATEGVDRTYDICIDEVCVSPGCGDASCNTRSPSFPPPDTHQLRCYTEGGVIDCPGVAGSASCGSMAFCGQDAQYGADVTSGGALRFERSTGEEPWVEDPVTGLVWQGCPVGARGADCSEGTAGVMPWTDAVVECDTLDWSGYRDWRLPNRFELRTLVDYDDWQDPAINDNAFPGTPAGSAFWSISTTLQYDGSAWSLGLIEGGVGVSPKLNSLHVRCVRGGPDLRAGHFERQELVGGEPTVSDARTDLVWQGCPSGLAGSACSGTLVTQTWHDALSLCESLDWGGHSDWRLPSVSELDSIVDDRRRRPAIDPAAFPNMPFASDVWSSTTRAAHRFSAWTVSFWEGGPGSSTKTLSGTAASLCVRDGP